VQPFIKDMAQAYGWADLVVCRAGALTVSELAAAGLPSLLVPLPMRSTITRPATPNIWPGRALPSYCRKERLAPPIWPHA